jgi:hypothetical protein
MATYNAVSRLWAASRPLTAVGLLMLAMAPIFIAAMPIDPRVITGAPAWLKPAKFAVSTGVFCLTLAWIFQRLPGWRRLRGFAGWMTAMVFVVEVAIIGIQAWRGTTSHFNIGTPFDGTLFSIMGAGIAVQTLMTVLVVVVLWLQRFEDRALGWALRLGLTLSLAGAASGGFMTSPTAAQLAGVRAGARLTTVGAHTVGAPDGGPGLPVTGWSLEHGDLRVPHFVGLHAVQALPGILFIVRRRRRLADGRQVQVVLAAAASYAALFALLLWQALRGQSIAAPDTLTLASAAIWGVATAVLAGWLFKAPAGSHRLERQAV